MQPQVPLDVSGYVLAGGKSSRMGTDKTMLDLAGRPLVQRAVEKLRRVCTEVSISGNRPELEVYAPLVRDVHEECGPLGGFEAALLHSTRNWNLLMAVDMPFVPIEFLAAWTQWIIQQGNARVALFTVDGKPQPALCLLHREIAPFLTAAIGRSEVKLYPVLHGAAQELAVRFGADLSDVFWTRDWVENELEWSPSPEQQKTRHLWFANLNTPEEFAAAQAFAGSLEMD
ncbi:MAG TPA: molybdenum cofactor guanylyltransferase [Edaphobacter sp.]|nr:molybdenum cofactor guanylyltransferase [Edaphobacter sp.]